MKKKMKRMGGGGGGGYFWGGRKGKRLANYICVVCERGPATTERSPNVCACGDYWAGRANVPNGRLRKREREENQYTARPWLGPTQADPPTDCGEREAARTTFVSSASLSLGSLPFRSHADARDFSCCREGSVFVSRFRNQLGGVVVVFRG